MTQKLLLILYFEILCSSHSINFYNYRQYNRFTRHQRNDKRASFHLNVPNKLFLTDQISVLLVSPRKCYIDLFLKLYIFVVQNS